MSEMDNELEEASRKIDKDVVAEYKVLKNNLKIAKQIKKGYFIFIDNSKREDEWRKGMHIGTGEVGYQHFKGWVGCVGRVERVNVVDTDTADKFRTNGIPIRLHDTEYRMLKSDKETSEFFYFGKPFFFNIFHDSEIYHCERKVNLGLKKYGKSLKDVDFSLY